MKVLLSDLTSKELDLAINNIAKQYGEEAAQRELSRANVLPILSSFVLQESIEGEEYWMNIVLGGDISKIPEVLTRTYKALQALGQNDSNNGILIPGEWYGVRAGTTRDVTGMFRYNGESTGRIGWDSKGNWRTDLDDSFDNVAELVPEGILALAFAAEARSRGYKLGVNTIHGLIFDENDEHEYNQRGVKEDYFFFHNIKVYANGDWGHCRIVYEVDETEEIKDRLKDVLSQLGISLN